MRFLTIAVMCLIGCITAHGQDDFSPSSPPEPGVPDIYSRIVVLKNVDEAGSVSGSGRYLVGNAVKLYAYVNSNYSFQCWTDTKGTVLGLSSPLSFTNTEKADTVIANYAFTPSNPNEPSNPSAILYYRLQLLPTQGCTVSGAGRYQAGKSVSVSASVESGYSFCGWTDSKGEIVSTSSYFSYTVPVDGEVLTANCVFSPGAPGEPGDPILRHNVSAVCSDGGTYYGNTGRCLEGTTQSLRASANSGYVFDGWYLNGELYTKLSSFSYTVGKEDMQFYAKFVFNPTSPGEPAMPALSTYSYYLPIVNTAPGKTVQYCINLVNTEIVKDMNIRLTFPPDFEVNPNDYTLSSNAVGYSVTLNEVEDNISIIEEGSKLWEFSFIGGETAPATQALLTFNIFIPDNVPTGTSKLIKINQISMVQADGTPVTARTRNGMLGVYKLGDVNGDNEVNVTDVLGTLSVINGVDDDSLIIEVADSNEDESINVSDILGIIEIINTNDNDE
ncbi:MAG: InlB B-repeat-containing protein [Prevotella sp.]